MQSDNPVPEPASRVGGEPTPNAAGRRNTHEDHQWLIYIYIYMIAPPPGSPPPTPLAGVFVDPTTPHDVGAMLELKFDEPLDSQSHL